MGQLRRDTLIAALFLAVFFGFPVIAHAESTPAITIELGRGFGEFIVTNQGAAVSLRSTVAVERRLGDKWQKAPVTNLELRNECLPSPAPNCIELGAKAILRPMPWTGSFCSAQCPVPCRLDGPAPPGTYRFVIASCHNERTYTSPPFKKVR